MAATPSWMADWCTHGVPQSTESALLVRQTETRHTGVERETGLRQEEHLGTQVRRARCLVAGSCLFLLAA